MQGGIAVDSLNITIGLRGISWTGGQGFSLNDKPVHIRGFSHHSDFGGVGGAVPDRINVFRANALRSVGGNTWRTSHNPYQPAVYDILDTGTMLMLIAHADDRTC
jgi:beta-galactosidase/beta-glucuronidase